MVLNWYNALGTTYGTRYDNRSDIISAIMFGIIIAIISRMIVGPIGGITLGTTSQFNSSRRLPGRFIEGVWGASPQVKMEKDKGVTT